MDKEVQCIVKARDDNTIIGNITNEYLYSMMLSHIEPVKEGSNIYNLKFIGRCLTPKNSEEIYMNMNILVNDPSVVTNNKYDIGYSKRAEYVKSYEFEKKENEYNSYRIDMAINTCKEDPDYFILELVNQASNTSKYIKINLEMFFKICIFIYKMLDINIIDGDIMLHKFHQFKVLPSSIDSYKMMKEERLRKVYTIYWNKHYILYYYSLIHGVSEITYALFPKDFYDQIKNTIGEEQYDQTENTGNDNIT